MSVALITLIKRCVKPCAEDSPHAEDSDKSPHKRHTGAWNLITSICVHLLFMMETDILPDTVWNGIGLIWRSCTLHIMHVFSSVFRPGHVADCIPFWFRTVFPQRMAHHNSSEIYTNRLYLSKHLKMTQIFSWYHKRLINCSLFPDIHSEVTTNSNSNGLLRLSSLFLFLILKVRFQQHIVKCTNILSYRMIPNCTAWHDVFFNFFKIRLYIFNSTNF